MDFNWKEFEEQKIVVHCSTLEEEKDFLNECNKRGYKYDGCLLDWYKGLITGKNIRYKRYDGCLLEFDGYYYHFEKIKNISSDFYENYVCPHFKYNSCYCNHKIINWKINKEKKMKKVKIQDLEKGKIYRFYTEEDLSKNIYMINGRGDLYCRDSLSCKSKKDFFKSSLSYNEVKNNYFVEIKREINWTKVPRGTKVQVKDSKKQKWKNAYFSKFLESNKTYPFKASFINDDEFTELNLDTTSWRYKYCKIHPSVEIPEEWYKEVW